MRRKIRQLKVGVLPRLCFIWPVLLIASPAQASIFQGETLDMVANILSWVVLVVAPVIAIGVFMLVHILPEKIAEKKKHPQAKAIQCLCLLSLFFGGILWPLAWIWAYTKPVLHKLAYGTDIDESHGSGHGTKGQVHAVAVAGPDDAARAARANAEAEASVLRAKVAQLEAKLARVSDSLRSGGEA